jgi:hypothetical protein
MGEFSRSGAQMPTEARREIEAEHEKDMRDAAELKHHRNEERQPKRRPRWKFWTSER